MKRLKAFIINDLMITQVVKQRLGNLIRIFNPNWYASTYIQDNLDQYLKPDAGWSGVSKLLLDMKADCQSKGVGFTVAILPAMQDFGNYPFEKIDEVTMSFCQKNDIDYVNILPYFKGQNFMDCWVSAIDSHPNSRAQRIFAKALADHFNKKILNRHQ